MKLLTNKLYDSVLIQPALSGANALKIVSGFASPLMVLKHLKDLEGRQKQIDVHLIYGMSSRDGVEIETHKAFVNIQKRLSNSRFECYYSTKLPTHAKIYTWVKKNKPIICYTGSANYTQNGFAQHRQREAMTKTNADEGLKFYNKVIKDCVLCSDESIKDHVQLYKSNKKYEQAGLTAVKLSLLDTRTGETHKTAGLNWGQRENRDKNEAYIPIPQEIARTNFFPKEECFTVLTDDRFRFLARRAQAGKKAIHSAESNAILGKYFRNRMGLEDGVRVTREHLKSYGRESVKFMKVDDETYIMDFAPPKSR